MKPHCPLYSLVALCLLLLASCDKDLDMTIVQKTLFEETAFDELSIDDAWNVTIVQDVERSGVTLSYSAFLEPYIRAKREGTAFELGISERLNLPLNTVMEATIYVRSLKSLSLDDASFAVLEGDYSGATLKLSLNHGSVMRGMSFHGDADINLDHASTVVDYVGEGRVCQLHLDEGSVFKGILEVATSLDIELDNASRMTLYEGGAAAVVATLDNASFLNMLPLEAGDMEIEMDNASEASVNVSYHLKGRLHNISKLYYQGNPALDVECDLTSSYVPL